MEARGKNTALAQPCFERQRPVSCPQLSCSLLLLRALVPAPRLLSAVPSLLSLLGLSGRAMLRSVFCVSLSFSLSALPRSAFLCVWPRCSFLVLCFSPCLFCPAPQTRLRPGPGAMPRRPPCGSAPWAENGWPMVNWPASAVSRLIMTRSAGPGSGDGRARQTCGCGCGCCSAAPASSVPSWIDGSITCEL